MTSLQRTKLSFLTLLFIVPSVVFGQGQAPVVCGWADVPVIVSRIVPPTFPAHEFDVTKFGAKGDGKTDCTGFFANAIEACHAAGGGRVVVPKGIFLTGPIHLLSNVEFHLSDSAIVRFSTNPKDYLPVVRTRFEGIECMNYSPLLYAYRQENIAITGTGVFDGQGSLENWWSWKGAGPKNNAPNQAAARAALVKMGEEGVPVEKRVFGEGSYLRPTFVEPYECRNILIKDVTFRNSPMWFLHPVLSTNVTIDRVSVNGLGPNNDGCDPESCTDVLIRNCSFNTGDDCIAIKSGRNNDGRRVNVPSANIIIQGCHMNDGHGGVVIGSEVSGGVRNVFAEDCSMDSPNLDRAIRIKTNSVRGGIVENVFIRKIRVGQVREAAVKINFFYEEGDAGRFTPVVRNIRIENLSCDNAKFAIWVKGYPRSPVRNLVLQDCTFSGIGEPNVMENVDGFTASNVIINGRLLK